MSLGPDQQKPSPRLLEQRMRNRLIEALELASSFESQRQQPTFVNAVNETINGWEDVDPIRWEWGFSDVYTAEEVSAVRNFHAVWDSVADRVPQEQFPDLGVVQDRPEWSELRDAALSALGVFAVRGKMPDDHEA